MVTSRYSSCGQADRRAHRLTATADAWHHAPPEAPPGGGSLDVPLSVWAQSAPESLVAGLITDLTDPPVLVAVVGLAADEIPATGQPVVAFHDHHQVPGIREAIPINVVPQVHGVTHENLSCRLAAMPGQLNLIVAADEWSRGEGFWTAARTALARGGYAAIVVASGNPRVHARVIRSAVTVGLGYVQHIAVVSPANLDRAVAVETEAVPSALSRRSLRRAHRDVFVFLRAKEDNSA